MGCYRRIATNTPTSITAIRATTIRIATSPPSESNRITRAAELTAQQATPCLSARNRRLSGESKINCRASEETAGFGLRVLSAISKKEKGYEENFTRKFDDFARYVFAGLFDC